VTNSGESPGFLERLWRGLRSGLSYSPRKFDRLTHSPKYLLDALRELFLERPELRDRIKLLHIGPVDAANSRYAKELGIENALEAPGYVSHTRSVELVGNADALFFCLADSSTGERNDCVPQKVYEYLGSRRPVLALTPAGDARDFFERAGTAVVCQPRSVSEIKAGVLALSEGAFQPASNEEFIRGFQRRNLTQQLARDSRPIDGTQTMMPRVEIIVLSYQGPPLAGSLSVERDRDRIRWVSRNSCRQRLD
jgi:hypothetical protein